MTYGLAILRRIESFYAANVWIVCSISICFSHRSGNYGDNLGQCLKLQNFTSNIWTLEKKKKKTSLNIE